MGNLLNMSGSLLKKGLPYDAEIEYLEGDGNSWIDTGYLPNQELRVYAEGILFRNAFQRGVTYGLLGCRESWYIRCIQFIVSNTGNYVLRFNNKIRTNDELSVPIGSYDAISMFMSKTLKELTVNGITYTSNMPEESTFNSDYTFCIFSTNKSGFYNAIDFGFKKVQLFNASILTRDFIPVRVGQTGYMYDKVSGQLFGNAGTGSFILGPDKTN